MTVQEFILKFREAFGEAAPLPIAIAYSDTPLAEIKSLPKCLVVSISKLRNGGALTLSAENVICGGGGLYARFSEMPERVPVFVSEVEHYKQSKVMVEDYVKSMDICLTDKPYLNLVRIDALNSWDDAEALLFFATPDILSGLCTWAYFDNNSPDAVSAPFASGCASMLVFAVNEHRKRGRRCFIGMMDPSARLLVPENELTFSLPICRFKEMLATMDDSALFQKAYSLIRKRIKR
nr:DUF169 domain-containing protein [Bacteroidales bacterium]